MWQSEGGLTCTDAADVNCGSSLGSDPQVPFGDLLVTD
jgi:hypothetical protein